VALVLRYSSLAALSAAVLAPVYHLLMHGADRVAVFIAIMAALLLWRHKKNIANLMAGTESRIGQKKKPAAP
jgi:glycerol-3-phosphate acyltransferase PlsY